MKEFLAEYFSMRNDGKITEKYMLMRIAITISVILLCLFAMGTTAFAYFSHDVTSQKNTIKSANFEANVSIQITNAQGESLSINSDNRCAPYANLKAGIPYFVTLTHSARSTAKTGFVIVTAERCQSTYHTQQLGKNGNGITETLTFTITVTNDTKVTFLSHWGTSSYYGYQNLDNPLYIIQGKTVTLTVTPAPNSTAIEETTAPETTSKPTNTNKLPTQTQSPETTSPAVTETKNNVEVTVPETTGVPVPPSSQTPETEPTEIQPETTVTSPETTVPETTILETEAPEATVEPIAETTPPTVPDISEQTTDEENSQNG